MGFKTNKCINLKIKKKKIRKTNCFSDRLFLYHDNV